MRDSASQPSIQSMDSVRLASVGVAVPPRQMNQEEVCCFLSEHYSHRLNSRSHSTMEKVFAHPSIRNRHFAIDALPSIIDEDPDSRIDRFTRWGVELACSAARGALERAGVGLESVKALVVNTCTGYICPGLSTYVLENLGLPQSTCCYDLVGAGCGGAVPNLQISRALMNQAEEDGAVLSISVEICSATFQMDDDLSLIVSNALFSDGAGAYVLWKRPRGLRLIDTASFYAPEEREAIRYVHRQGALFNQLSLRLPSILKDHIQRIVDRLLIPQGLTTADVSHWAIHPGGARIMDAIQQTLSLSDEQVRVSRQVLEEYGNISSATVWFELCEILRDGIAPGEWCVMLGAGAGLSIHGFLFKG